MNYTDQKYFQVEVDENGIALLTLNQEEQSENLFSTAFIQAYLKFGEAVIQDDNIKGVILTSGKRMFMPGADLREVESLGGDPENRFNGLVKMHQSFRAVEKSGKPFVAAINGTALGGGFELTLTCHHRIAINHPSIKIGLPEAKVGLLPGAGGTIKLIYLSGIQKGLQYLLQGRELRPQQALENGWINDLADSQDQLIQKAKDWIKENPSPVQPWDNKKYKIPGGGLFTPNGMMTFAGTVGNVAKLANGNYPNQEYILKVVHDGIQVPFDRALEIEARYFTKALNTKEAANMIRTGFINLTAAKKGIARPKDEARYEVKKLGILGAGMMGAGIAYVSAKAGMDVVLKDISIENAEKGKAYSEKLLDKAISRGRSTEEKKNALLKKINCSVDTSDLEGCDLVIEAVFEDPLLKDSVTKETEAVLSPDKVYASNTSTIPISFLAKSSVRPENFIGIHFFSPVDKMLLVEIIVGEKTSDKAIAAAIDYTTSIKKIPIVVNDSRGFYTSRCFGTFANEGMFLLEEGVKPALIENIAKQIGMPVGPLAVLDEVTLTLSQHVAKSDPELSEKPERMRALNIIEQMIAKGRTSKKDGAGFYAYPTGEKKHLWSGLKDLFPFKENQPHRDEIGKRILHRQALEAFRCLDEGVLRSAADGDLGSVLGWGFPIYTGGALSYLDFIGINNFIFECDQFAEKFQDKRWLVPDSLRSFAQRDKSIHQFIND